MKFKDILSVCRDAQFINIHYNNIEMCKTRNNFDSFICNLEVVLVTHNIDCLEVWLK